MQKPIHEAHNSDSFEGAIIRMDTKLFSMDENHFVLGVFGEDESAFKESNCGCGFFLPREVIIPDKRGRWLAWIMETY